MSATLLKFAVKFCEGHFTAEKFADPYIYFYQIERDGDIHEKDGEELTSLLFTIFCEADCYDPNPSDSLHEINEDQLRQNVTEAISMYDPYLMMEKN